MGSEVQVDKYSGWLQMKSSGGLRTEKGRNGELHHWAIDREQHWWASNGEL